MADVDLEALAARCEAAAGPDRELDFAIAASFHPGLTGSRTKAEILSECPKYTGSIEDARSLVQEEEYETIWSGTGAKVSSAQLVHHKPLGKWRPHSIYAVAASEPLALCAVALRARAA